MLLSVLLQAAAGAAIGKLGAALELVLPLSVQVWVLVRSVVRQWKLLPVNRKLQAIFV